MTQHIGIVAGSAEGAALCYRTICLEALAVILAASAHKVAQAGANFAICPDNTYHQSFKYLISQSPIPWIHIAGAVADEAQRSGFRRLGILGTKYLTESSVY